jgi:hypothetical protein
VLDCADLAVAQRHTQARLRNNDVRRSDPKAIHYAETETLMTRPNPPARIVGANPPARSTPTSLAAIGTPAPEQQLTRQAWLV